MTYVYNPEAIKQSYNEDYNIVNNVIKEYTTLTEGQYLDNSYNIFYMNTGGMEGSVNIDTSLYDIGSTVTIINNNDAVNVRFVNSKITNGANLYTSDGKYINFFYVYFSYGYSSVTIKKFSDTEWFLVGGRGIETTPPIVTFSGD